MAERAGGSPPQSAQPRSGRRRPQRQLDGARDSAAPTRRRPERRAASAGRPSGVGRSPRRRRSDGRQRRWWGRPRRLPGQWPRIRSEHDAGGTPQADGRAAWPSMTPEERERFQERMRERHGQWWWRGRSVGGQRARAERQRWTANEQRARGACRHEREQAPRPDSLTRHRRQHHARRLAPERRDDDRCALRTAAHRRDARPRVALHRQEAEADQPAARRVATARSPRS